ncbi:hypothetical protein PV325_000922 [Microctonus aethiopoides]|nr:hypothetical protein PV325_000922 [Microctonus aethiopoides]
MISEEIPGNFRTLWLKYTTSSDPHQVFFKEHSVRNQDPECPKGKTLFVLNVPPYVNLKLLKAVFHQNCGPVKFAKFQSGRPKGGFKIAFIVFMRESSLEKALTLKKDVTFVLNTEENPCILGIQQWCKEYNSAVVQNEKELKSTIEKYMESYDSKVEAKLTANVEEEENDGWTTVSSKKKRGQFAPVRKESTIEKIQTVEERKNKKKQLLNFYTFQIRESKKQHLAELRKKFELDKQKLQQLKAKRTFKPFV